MLNSFLTIYFIAFLTFPILSSIFYIRNIYHPKSLSSTYLKFFLKSSLFILLAFILNYISQIIFISFLSNEASKNNYLNMTALGNGYGLFFSLPLSFLIFAIGSKLFFRKNKKFAYLLAILNIILSPFGFLILYLLIS